MLAEHLSQSHDMASRRFEWIDRQVDWIHRNLLNEKPSDILDLGCGPGFYSHRLISRGHRCRGIDFGPASIDYASNNNPDASRCQFILGDIRNTAFGEPYDLAMVLFGEMNVFSPAEIAAILRKCQANLAARRGRLILEIETPESVERRGHDGPSEQQCDAGLFSRRLPLVPDGKMVAARTSGDKVRRLDHPMHKWRKASLPQHDKGMGVYQSDGFAGECRLSRDFPIW